MRSFTTLCCTIDLRLHHVFEPCRDVVQHGTQAQSREAERFRCRPQLRRLPQPGQLRRCSPAQDPLAPSVSETEMRNLTCTRTLSILANAGHSQLHI